MNLAEAIRASAQRLGVNPLDLGTVISYETAGTFDPWKAGPTTQWGQHRGLIQWGEPQRQKYGVYQGMPVDQQLKAVESYLTDAGVRPGTGILDLYSAINAGRVGRHNASDANNGGAPGTVQDKVEQQMGGHREKAAALLGDAFTPPTQTAQAGPATDLQKASMSDAQLALMYAPQINVAAADPTAGIMQAFQAQGLEDERRRRERADDEVRRRRALFGGPVASLFG